MALDQERLGDIVKRISKRKVSTKRTLGALSFTTLSQASAARTAALLDPSKTTKKEKKAPSHAAGLKPHEGTPEMHAAAR